MCMALAARSVEAWLETQEAMLRTLCAEAALDPDTDPETLARWERHCRWLAEERARMRPRPAAA